MVFKGLTDSTEQFEARFHGRGGGALDRKINEMIEATKKEIN